MAECIEPAGIMRYSLVKRIKLSVVEKLLKLDKTDVVLDLGAGSGYFAKECAKHSQRVIALDCSEANIESAKGFLADFPNISFIVADATALPFRDGSFDKVLASDIIEHLSEDQAFLKEIARALRNGGISVIATPCTEPTLSLDWLRKKMGFDFGKIWGHKRAGYTEREICKLINGAGLKPNAVKYYLVFFGELVRIIPYFVRKMRSKDRGWINGSDLVGLENTRIFAIFKAISPLLYCFSKLDVLLSNFKGHQIAVRAVRRE